MTLYKNFLLKRGVGLFSRAGLISGDYGSDIVWNMFVFCLGPPHLLFPFGKCVNAVSAVAWDHIECI